MNSMAPDRALSQTAHESLQQQLFRYAQDLQDLVGQQLELQERYRTVLGFLGHSIPDDDVLAGVLFKGPASQLKTDRHGNLMSVAHSDRILGPWEQWARHAAPIGQLESEESAGVFQAVLDKFVANTESGGLEYREVTLKLPGATGSAQRYSVLAMQAGARDKGTIHWLLMPLGTHLHDGAQALGGFVRHVPGDTGLLATGPDGSIVDINSALTHITGYTREELRGQSPRTYGSGHHTTAFFHDFWLGLLDKGRWEGHMLNRRKDGAIFLTWQSIRMVEDVRGRVFGYVAATVDMSPRPEPKGPHNHSVRDPLTGLVTRAHFDDLFERALVAAGRDERSLALFILDIDGIKQLGESFGFGSGDQLRRQLGHRLMALERPGLHVAQISSDDFVLLLESDPSEGEITATANAALAVTTSAFHMGRHNVYLQACIGCARFPQDGRDQQTLIERADAAMYGAKQFNRRFSFFETESQSEPT